MAAHTQAATSEIEGEYVIRGRYKSELARHGFKEAALNLNERIIVNDPRRVIARG